MTAPSTWKRHRLMLLMVPLLSVAFLFIGCLAHLLLANRGPRVTKAGIIKTEAGLGKITEKEIEQLFGGPGEPTPSFSSESPNGAYERLWRGEQRFSVVRFDAQGVAVKQWQGFTREPGFVDRIQMWLTGDL